MPQPDCSQDATLSTKRDRLINSVIGTLNSTGALSVDSYVPVNLFPKLTLQKKMKEGYALTKSSSTDGKEDIPSGLIFRKG